MPGDFTFAVTTNYVTTHTTVTLNTSVNIRKPQSFHFKPFPFLISSSSFFYASVNVTIIVTVRTAGRA